MIADYTTSEGKNVIDWTATEEHAETLTVDQLIFAIKDCSEAAKAARQLERAGNHVKKDEGFYTDERSVYSKELEIRRKKS